MIAALARFLVLHCLGLVDGLRAELSRGGWPWRCAECAQMQPAVSWQVMVPSHSSGASGACLACARRLTLDDIQRRRSEGDLRIAAATAQHEGRTGDAAALTSMADERARLFS